MTENTPTRLLDAAEELMLSKGFTGTAVDEICASADVSKGSFYHHFQSKDALGLAALDRFYNRVADALFTGSWTEVDDPVQRALAFLDHTIDRSDALWHGGCLMGTFALDLAEANEAYRTLLSERFDEMTAALTDVLAPISGPNTPSGEEMAELYMAVIEGAIILGKAHGDPTILVDRLSSFRTQLTFFSQQNE